MTDLIKRLEEAEAGSRELSDAVLLACGAMEYDWKSRKYSRRPSPTQSLDDALGLVPEGWEWEAASFAKHNNEPRAGLWRNLYSNDIECIASHGATPALALCIAVLKAREAEEER